MKVNEITESSGHIPKDKEEANDPRWSNALTVDIGPGEDKKQAAKMGFSVSDKGPPVLRADGKIDEAVMSVSVQGKYPISPGARGLMGARFRYDKSIEDNHKHSLNGAVAQLEHNLKYIPKTNYDYINMLMQTICEKFRVEPKNLHNAFIKKFSCSPDKYAVQYKKSREGKPVNV